MSGNGDLARLHRMCELTVTAPLLLKNPTIFAEPL